MDQYINQLLTLRRHLYLAHHIPGRVRLKYSLGIIAKVASFRQQDIEQTLTRFPAFQGYQLNPVTGSVVIEYDPQIIDSKWITQLFAADEQQARRACYAIADQLSMSEFFQDASA